MSSKTLRAAVAAAFFVLPAAAAAAAVDYFLKIDGIEGESLHAGHAKEIDIESWSWGASSTTSSGGNRAGRACVNAFNFTKPVDKASPLLMANAVSGMTLKTAVLTARKAGKEQQEYLKVTLENVLVTSYQGAGSTSALPVDHFSLNFARMTIEYKPQKPDGSLGPAVTTTFPGGC